MPVLKVVDMSGKETGEITLSDVVFGCGGKRHCSSHSGKSISFKSETGYTVYPHTHRGFRRR